MSTCKNCGKKYSGGSFSYFGFCCPGCKLDYENKQAANRKSGSGKVGCISWIVGIALAVVIIKYILKAL